MQQANLTKVQKIFMFHSKEDNVPKAFDGRSEAPASTAPAARLDGTFAIGKAVAVSGFDRRAQLAAYATVQ